ncbi:MAG TPA: MFS transporter [Thermoanaerobaculia bacterium]|nr:MFS transporter [Thermoanaerobaculia bacterium]
MASSVKRSENQPAGRLDPGVLTLGWVSFLTDFASDMIYPLLPDFLTRRLGAGPAVVGLIEGVAEATASLTKLFAGWWSDRTRRRKPLVVAGYSLATLVRPFIGLATSWLTVFAIRFADRVGKGIRTAPRDALIAALVPPAKRGRAFGLQRAMDNAGSVAGPLAAALLLKTLVPEERSVFLLAFIPGILAVVLLVRRVREAPAPVPAPGQPRDRAEKERLPRGFWIATSLFVVFTLANSTDAFLLLRARDSGIPLWQIPLLWAFFNGVKAAAGVPGGALSDRIGRVACVGMGWVVYAIAYVGFAFVSTPAGVWALFGGYALFFALTEGAQRALVADLVGDTLRGRAFGIFHGSIGIAALPSSILFGIWWKAFGPRTAFLIGAALAAVAVVGLFVARAAVGRRSVVGSQ